MVSCSLERKFKEKNNYRNYLPFGVTQSTIVRESLLVVVTGTEHSTHLGTRATRILLPLVSTAKLAALLVRFERLQISWSFWSLSELNQHSFMIAAASLLPIVAISVARFETVHGYLFRLPHFILQLIIFYGLQCSTAGVCWDAILFLLLLPCQLFHSCGNEWSGQHWFHCLFGSRLGSPVCGSGPLGF